MSTPQTVWRYTLHFVTPAFLGDADQSARWHTPPIKAQLRQWWRVAYAAQGGHRVSVDRMRTDEARLFGAVGEGDRDSGRSLVRLRLDRWDEGSLNKSKWETLPGVHHREAKRDVAADLYLGYGPVTPPPKGEQSVRLKANAAIQAGDHATLAIGLDGRVGAADEGRLRLALHLMHLYGTLGGRSRNGWGSYVLEPQDGTPTWPAQPDERCLRPWRDALALDWAHAIGRDERGPLVWRTTGEKADDWRAVMVELAKLKIELRTALGFTTGKGAREPERRHWLAYPVTNHSVHDWGDALRLPNTLRFKLRPAGGTKAEGIVFHMPALPPPAFGPQRHRAQIDDLWRDVHDKLDRRLLGADGRKVPR
jgi:CRISPR-associated protein Cmr1